MKKLIAASLITLTTGCASIVSDSTYPVAITGADHTSYEIKNSKGIPIASGFTPSQVSLKAHEGFFSSADYTIINKSPCGNAITPLDSSLDGWYLGNLLFGGIIGFLIIDPATGAMWKLPEVVTVNTNECAES